MDNSEHYHNFTKISVWKKSFLSGFLRWEDLQIVNGPQKWVYRVKIIYKIGITHVYRSISLKVTYSLWPRAAILDFRL